MRRISPQKKHGRYQFALIAMASIISLSLPSTTTCFSVTTLHKISSHQNIQFASTRRRTRNDLKMSATTNQSNSKQSLFEPLGKGIKRDMGRRLPLYKSDIIDGLNTQTLATILFLFFACLAPAIGFGGISDIATKGAIGALEMVTSTALCGLIYGLFSAQPVLLMGPTGPNLAFTVSLYHLAKKLSVPFLPFYAWTGLWTSGMLFASSLVSASNIARYITRFTDEIFNVLLSGLFIIDSISDISKPFIAASAVLFPATKSLMSLVCASVTYGTATVLKGINKTSYFTKRIRSNLSNFAPALAVVLGSLIAKGGVSRYGSLAASLPSLSLPSKFATTSGRPWLIPLLDCPVWARWGAAAPAMLCTMLLFLTQVITARLVNNPRNQMKKARTSVEDGMHADLLVVSILTGITSILGLPWMAAVTTRSAAHVRSLSKNEDKDDPSRITGMIENRISPLGIHALIGACAILSSPRKLLSQVPLPVLSGVLLYLGFTSLQGLELWDRIRGLFQDSTQQKYHYSKLSGKVVRNFTLIQMACVGAMMRVTKSSLGVVSPLIVAFLPFLRNGIVRLGMIPKKYMEILDGSNANEEEVELPETLMMNNNNPNGSTVEEEEEEEERRLKNATTEKV